MGRVTAHRDTCVGSGQCVLAAPEVFDQSEVDGRVVLLRAPENTDSDAPVTAEVPPEQHEPARTAAAWCPAGAIEAPQNTEEM